MFEPLLAPTLGQEKNITNPASILSNVYAYHLDYMRIRALCLAVTNPWENMLYYDLIPQAKYARVNLDFNMQYHRFWLKLNLITKNILEQSNII